MGEVRLGDIVGVSGFSVGHCLVGPRLLAVDDGGRDLAGQGENEAPVVIALRSGRIRFDQEGCSAAGLGAPIRGAGSALGSKTVAPRPIRPMNASTIMATP
jgi:hypothetical protein